MYRPHPFSWVPAEGQRHATTDPKPRQGYDGVEVRTLCLKRVTVDNSDIGWLWPTCSSCNTGAHELAGVPAGGETEE
ncbi:zinc finger protein [Saccharopolyspora flava]|uniref:Zinc-finger n=1 Tax=Saccharopolyspora flava TaxID=95161 RepID=A0A1I6SZM3_9PSEU|nr:zinc finger protein [Saccharopolyspora flava]SFS82313.1 zinc-finger [Saccharopolyspora flava]